MNTMNRRDWLRGLGIAAVALAATPLLGLATKPRKHEDIIGDYETEGGFLSLGGQTRFPVYENNGGISRTSIRYRHVAARAFRAEECAL